MAAHRPSVRRCPQTSDSYLDENGDVELEIFHDTRWPRLRLGTNEIISVIMAVRIIRLLKDGHTNDCIPCHVVEEFDREIDKESIEALLEKNFDITEEPLPGGEHLIPTELPGSVGIEPAIDEQGYARGVVIPAGIYYEIIAISYKGPVFIQQYLMIRWGLDMCRSVIAHAIDGFKFEEALRRSDDSDHESEDEDDVFPELVPEHDGRRLSTLATSPEQTRNEAVVFFNNPPPAYEPRPVFRGLELRHPREIVPVDGHLPPFFTDQTPDPPSYSSDMDPPSYDNMDVDLETRSPPPPPPPPSSSSPPPSQTVSQRSNQLASESSSSVATTAQAELPAFQGKSKHPQPQKYYSRSNVVDLLFDGLHEIDLYPDGPFEPVRLQDEGLRNMRKLAELRFLERIGFRQGEFSRFLDFVILKPQPHFSSEGKLVFELVEAFFRELSVSGCVTSRDVIVDFPISVSFAGFCYIINHMRLSRGAPEIYSHKPDAFLGAVLEELQLSSNPSVLKVLAKRGPDLTAAGQNLEDLCQLFTEIREQREGNPPVRLDFYPDDTTSHRIVAPGFDDQLSVGSYSTSPSWSRDAADLIVNNLAEEHREWLRKVRGLIWGLFESTEADFPAGKRILENLALDLQEDTDKESAEDEDMKKIIAQIRGLKDVSEASQLSLEWWAAVATNFALTQADHETRSTLWLSMSDEEPSSDDEGSSEGESSSDQSSVSMSMSDEEWFLD